MPFLLAVGFGSAAAIVLVALVIQALVNVVKRVTRRRD